MYLIVVLKYAVLIFIMNTKSVWSAVKWENIRCATDSEQAMPEGIVRDIARFPWFGVVQHTFYLGGKTRFAVTSGVLIHPTFAIAPAEDISRIQMEALLATTRRPRTRGLRRGIGRVRRGRSATSPLVEYNTGVASGRGIHGRCRVRTHGPNIRPGPCTIDELKIYDITEGPTGQCIETPLHPKRMRMWQPSNLAAPDTPSPIESSSSITQVEVKSDLATDFLQEFQVPSPAINNTKFIVWQSKTLKYSLDIETYYLAPDFTEGLTLASLALLQILTFGSRAPVLPVCLPIKGAGMLTELFVIKMTDEKGEVDKEIVHMDYVENQECEEFYFKHNLSYKKMSPARALCARGRGAPCVWEAGAALVARHAWGHWELIGFSARGPGCGAPARFINVYHHLPWIDEVISDEPSRVREEGQPYVFRRVSPIKLILYKAKVRHPRELGQCSRRTRGGVLYKDDTELLTNKNFAQGFFFLSMAQVAQVNCVTVTLHANSRTNAAVWLEHHCHRDLSGDRVGPKWRDFRQHACFVYFKSVAYVEFRFYFSFKATLEVTLYGHEETQKIIPNPFSKASTYSWVPTYSKIKNSWFMPHYVWWWYM